MKKLIILVCIVTIQFYCAPKQEKVERISENGVEIVINHLEPYQIGNISSFTLEEIFKIDTEEEEIINLGITDILLKITNS